MIFFIYSKKKMEIIIFPDFYIISQIKERHFSVEILQLQMV